MNFDDTKNKNETLNSQTDNNWAIGSLLSTLSNLEFEQARVLARNGEYNQAKNILDGILQRGPNSSVMDLLARIYAQQGQLEKARYYWEKAILLDPQDIDINKGLGFISKIQNQNTQRIRNWTPLYIVFFSLVFCALLGLVIFQVNQFHIISSKLDFSSSAQPISDADSLGTKNILELNSVLLETIQAQISTQYKNLDTRISENQVILNQLSTNANEQPAIPPTLSIPVEFSIVVPGTSVKIEGNKALVRFDRRLFLYGDEFSNNGEQMLLQVGKQLEPWLGKIQINVIGFTDSLEVNKVDLPLDRSNTAVKYLVNHTRLPVSIFTITSGEGLPSPFPPNSTGDLYRERTVLIEIAFLSN